MSDSIIKKYPYIIGMKLKSLILSVRKIKQSLHALENEIQKVKDMVENDDQTILFK